MKQNLFFAIFLTLMNIAGVISQSCAYSNVCGDGYCCKYSSGCVCSAESCREQCAHGDLMPNYVTVKINLR